MRRLLLVALVLAPVAFADDGPRIVDEWLPGERKAEDFAVTAIAVFAGGRGLLIATHDELKSADRDDDFETRPFLKRDSLTRAAAVTSDGRFVAATGWFDNQVTIYDSWRKKKVNTLAVVQEALAVGFSPRGDRIIVAGNSRDLAILDVASKTVVAQTRMAGIPVGAGFTDDGERAWCANTSGEIFLHDPGTLACVRSFSLNREVISVAMSVNGEQLVSCGGTTVERLNRVTLRHERFALDEAAKVMGVSPDGSLIVVSGERCRLSFVTGPPRGLKGHAGCVEGLAIAPTGSLAVSTGADGTARLWRTRTGEHLRVLEHADALGPVAFSPDGERVLLATESGLALFDHRKNRVVQRFDGLRDLSAVGFGESGAFVREPASEDAVQFSRAGERTWKLRVGQRFAPETITGFPFGLAVSPSRKRALVVASDLTLWDLEKPGRVHAYENCPYAAASPIAFSADEKLAAVYHSDHKLRLWKLEAPWAVSLVDLGRAVPTAIAFAPDSTWLLVGTDKGRILKVDLGSAR